MTLDKLLRDGSVWLGKSTELPPSVSPLVSPCEQPAIEDFLSCGAIHEWSLVPESSHSPSQQKQKWYPPLFLLSAIINRKAVAGKHIFWIGKHCWPTPTTFESTSSLQYNSLFIDPPNHDARLWATLETLNSPTVQIVIADGSKLNMVATRRLQLAAEKGHSLGLIVRPPWEQELLSAARTRWKVSPLPSTTRYPKWSVELFQAKGAKQVTLPTFWEVESNGGKENTLTISATVVDRAQQTQASTERKHAS